MFKEWILLLLLAHALGDYYFQTGAMALAKNRRFGPLAVHSLLYGLSFLLVSLPFFSSSLFLCGMLLTLSHFVIDLVKSRLSGPMSFPPARQRALYFADQSAHLLCLLAAAFFLASRGQAPEPLPFAERLLRIAEITAGEAILWPAVLLMLMKPANITIKQLLSVYKPAAESRNNSPEPGKDAARHAPDAAGPEAFSASSGAVPELKEMRDAPDTGGKRTGDPAAGEPEKAGDETNPGGPAPSSGPSGDSSPC